MIPNPVLAEDSVRPAGVTEPRLRLATRFSERLVGLLGRSAIDGFDGLWIEPCDSVHTIGMRFDIDLIFLDRSATIRRIVTALPPWRLCRAGGARAVIELRAGQARRWMLSEGDRWPFARPQVPLRLGARRGGS